MTPPVTPTRIQPGESVYVYLIVKSSTGEVLCVKHDGDAAREAAKKESLSQDSIEIYRMVSIFEEFV